MRQGFGISAFGPQKCEPLPHPSRTRFLEARARPMSPGQRSGQPPSSRPRSFFLSLKSILRRPFFPDPRNAFKASAGKGMTRAVDPSTTHSTVELGAILSFLRTAEGIETCPRFVTLVRIIYILQVEWPYYK